MRDILLLLCFICLVISSANRAPDVAPEMPDDWCNDGDSTRTRTTGECICKPGRECKGSRCINEQGFKFYGLDCKDCACVKSESRGESTPEGVAFKKPKPKATETKSIKPVYVDDEIQEDKESFMDKLDFIFDDLGKYLVAGGAIAVVVVLLVSAAATLPTKEGEETSESRPKPAKKAD
jgi:hypothetical protein